MDWERLQLQQYLQIHPFLHKGAKLRRKYVGMIAYFVRPQNSDDLWVRQLFELYVHKLADSAVEVGSAELRVFNWWEKFRFPDYPYYLLTDCLFIAAFADKERGQALCAEISEVFGKSYRDKLVLLYEAFYAETYEGFERIFKKMQAIYRVIWNNRRFLQQPLRKVLITANMSAGKSTLINALAGKKLNKTQNAACTAKIHYLYNKAGEDGFTYELDAALELDASLETLMTDNEDNLGTEIVVGTRFRSLQEIDRRLCLIDTPGVNSSIHQGHRDIARSALQKEDCGLLLYVFNGENIGSDDDAKHLCFIKDNFKGKIVFLVNRLDKYRAEEDSVPETLAAVKEDLAGLGFAQPEVYPLSAYAAYLAKLALYREPLTKDEEDDKGFFELKLKEEEYSFERYYPVQVDTVGRTDPSATLLLHSGLLSLEQILYR